MPALLEGERHGLSAEATHFDDRSADRCRGMRVLHDLSGLGCTTGLGVLDVVVAGQVLEVRGGLRDVAVTA